jgi:hypothetical protein
MIIKNNLYIFIEYFISIFNTSLKKFKEFLIINKAFKSKNLLKNHLFF